MEKKKENVQEEFVVIKHIKMENKFNQNVKDYGDLVQEYLKHFVKTYQIIKKDVIDHNVVDIDIVLN